MIRENAITLTGIRKRFRKVSLRKNYRTFKSLLLETLKPRRKKRHAVESEAGDNDGYFDALKEITLDIPKGEMYGLIGRNGSGKSTLLKLIAGIYRTDAGSLTINGKVSALIELGAGFHPEFSGRENIFINASILGMPKKLIEEKFDQIVAFAELEDFIDNPVRTYSSGMFMRLGFSIAIHVDPDILLIDEVLAVGDEAFGHKCKEKIEGFRKAGKTILLVTHDLSQVERWCDQVIWLDKGKLRMMGKPARVVDAYLAEVAEAENVHELREAAKEDAGDRKRWGSREVEITAARFIDETGEERRVFGAGSAMGVHIDYVAHEPVFEPVFGVGIHKSDGAHCYGTNTDIEGIEIERIETGSGSFSISFAHLDLLEGSYTLSVAVHAKDGHAYDYHDQAFDFSFRSKLQDVGVFRPPHSWSLNGVPLQTVSAESSE